MGMDRMLYFCLSSLERGEDMIFLWMWEGTLKCFFWFLLWSEVTKGLKFILAAGASAMATEGKCCCSSSYCCFLTCIQTSQEAGQVVWCSHLLKNFPQFVVIHTIKSFGIVNKAEVDFYLELSCFFDDPTDVGNLISGFSAFSKSSLNIWKFSVLAFY